MTWSFWYGEKQLGRNLSYAAVDQISEEILGALRQARGVTSEAVWLQLQHPSGEGNIGEERILISPGIPIAFLEE